MTTVIASDDFGNLRFASLISLRSPWVCGGGFWWVSGAGRIECTNLTAVLLWVIGRSEDVRHRAGLGRVYGAGITWNSAGEGGFQPAPNLPLLVAIMWPRPGGHQCLHGTCL